MGVRCGLAALALAAGCLRTARDDRTPLLGAHAIQAAVRDAAAPGQPPLTQDEMALHVLDRITFGPRPGDRERVRAMGVAAFVEQQLHPEEIDDEGVRQQLASLTVLRASADALLQGLHPEPGSPAVQAVKRSYLEQLSEAKVIRAVSSGRQLQEVMVDFWFNHFNVYAGKGDEAALLPDYESRALLPNALGTFPQLLEAVARSPAMLIYLDNWRSSVERPKAKRPRGINENYARELLELHTMGSDGGYKQADVVEVARCFTGWTVVDPRKDPRFVFKPELHDFGEKVVLGHLIPAGGGVEDALEVLHILEQHPATARFVSKKLVRRFVSDDPPDELVRRVSDTYAATQGDIESMLRTIFASPEFFSRKALRAKVRSPLELVAAAARALGARVDDAAALVQAVRRMGQPLYQAQPPTGYPDQATTWLSSGALLARIDFGLSLANGRLPGVSIDLSRIRGNRPEQVLANAAAALGASDLSERTRNYVLDQLRAAQGRPQAMAPLAVSLLLGAPEWQRR
jgi:uncharacterized protein (DUF1800 family)